MVTAQNVRDVRFSKTMGGYKTAEVDAFLDQCADTIEALGRDVDDNTKKMQVLAETIVEYRNQEDSIRTALLNAQRMSDTVVNEAKEQASAIIEEAEVKSANIESEAKKRIQEELDELARIQKEVVAFRSKLLATYREHLTLIGILTDEQKDAPAEAEVVEEVQTPAVEEAVEPIVEEPVVSISAHVDEVKIDISAFELQDDE
jgi:cell division initiation protein